MAGSVINRASHECGAVCCDNNNNNNLQVPTSKSLPCRNIMGGRLKARYIILCTSKRCRG
jgi:hypothetical protein